MTASIGYTRKQAERIKQRINVEAAKIEDGLVLMKALVPDCDPNRFTQIGIDGIGEEVRAIAHGLSETVDRRTRDDA